MKPELIVFFRHIVNTHDDLPTLQYVKTVFDALSNDELLEIIRPVSPLDINIDTVRDNLSDALNRLLFKHGPFYPIFQYIPPEVKEVDMSKQKTAYLRLIGDVHGKYDKYAHLASEAEYSLQVGDMGFDYSYITRIVDSEKHKVVGGNHDNYSKKACIDCYHDDIFDICEVCQGKGYVYADQSKHFLKDYGVWQIPDFEPIFYVRGAWSIDYKYRTPNISWWEDEEMPQKQMDQALKLYEELKPDFVVTHTAPVGVIPYVPFDRIFGDKIVGTRTEDLLQQMWNMHQPKKWFFGHWHVSWDSGLIHPQTNKETNFICLAELAYKDLK